MNYPYFSEDELRCRCGCGRADMDDDFMAKLIALREECDFPFIINSGYRCQKHDRAVGGAGNHTQGRAVDIRVSGHRAFALLSMAAAMGMTGIGVKQTGPHKQRFIHLDDLDSSIRPWVWSY